MNLKFTIMKRFFNYIAVALAMTLLAAGCTPEILAPDQGKLPEASALEVVITPDQTTNFVTFSVTNAQGIVPMWIFGADKIDGKENKKFSYTGNDLVLRIREAGTHQVEVKAYNANGISVGSKIVEYTLENTYRDPFDPSPYMKKLAKEWMWNYEVAGHIGCGPDTSDPTSWWSAGPNEKADWGLYDDYMTFSEDGKYSFNPGEDGKVYVNAGFTALGTSPDGNDFLVDIPAYETTYTVENSWNDAGIEEIWLALPATKNLSYIPNQTIYDNPRFLITALTSKEVKFAAANAPNGDGTISWQYNFVPAVKAATPEELLAGTAATGKAWVMDSAVQGHVGCGWDAENAAGWWAAGPNEKADFGMYDDVVTFFPDGKYVYETGADGKMYINKEVTKVGPGGASEDIDVDYAGIEATYEFDGEKIVLPAGTPMVYVSSDAIWENPEFIVTELTETTLKVVTFANTVGNPDGIAWQMIFRARDVQAAPEPEQPSAAPFDPAADENLWKNAAINVTYWFADSSWGQIADPEATLENNEYTFVVPEGVGGSEWQGQVVFRNTGIVCSPDKSYDFRVLLTATADGTATIKPCYEHPTEKDGNGNPADVNELFYDNTIALLADEELEYVKSGLAGTDIPDLKLVFDFGRFPAGTTITVKGIVLREAQAAPAPEPTPDPETPFAPGESLDLAYTSEILVGTWTWEASTDGHFGCGDAIANPTGWWNGAANCKDGCSLYDDTMTFAEDGTYTYDPVDGMTFMNNGVTKLDSKKVDNPTVPGASAPEGDFRVSVEKQTVTWELDESGEFPLIVLPAGTIFSYIPNDAFLDAPELYVTALWENQVEISAYTATGNGGGPIAWRYRLKKVQ